jgi:hypothetical protein
MTIKETLPPNFSLELNLVQNVAFKKVAEKRRMPIHTVVIVSPFPQVENAAFSAIYQCSPDHPYGVKIFTTPIPADMKLSNYLRAFRNDVELAPGNIHIYDQRSMNKLKREVPEIELLRINADAYTLVGLDQAPIPVFLVDN